MITTNNLPPWLACPPPIDEIVNPSNNNNPSLGPTFSSGIMGIGGPYQTQASGHMSATALLQKAAQMGATMSNTTPTPQPHHHLHHHNSHHHLHHQGHVPDTNSTAGLFGLNLSSLDQHQTMPTSTTTPTPTPHTSNSLSSVVDNPNPNPNSNLSPNPNPNLNQAQSAFLHDMMINSLPTSYDHHDDDDAFGIGSMGTMMGSSNTSTSKKNDPSSLATFHRTMSGRGGGGNTHGGGGGGNEGLTRDFLGLRQLSQSEILTMARLGNCMNTNNTTTNAPPPTTTTTTNTSSHHHQQESHKSWQS